MSPCSLLYPLHVRLRSHKSLTVMIECTVTMISIHMGLYHGQVIVLISEQGSNKNIVRFHAQNTDDQ